MSDVCRTKEQVKNSSNDSNNINKATDSLTIVIVPNEQGGTLDEDYCGITGSTVACIVNAYKRFPLCT